MRLRGGSGASDVAVRDRGSRRMLSRQSWKTANTGRSEAPLAKSRTTQWSSSPPWSLSVGPPETSWSGWNLAWSSG